MKGRDHSWRGAIVGGGEQSRLEGSDSRERGAITGEREAITGGGERSLAEWSNHRWSGAIIWERIDH